MPTVSRPLATALTGNAQLTDGGQSKECIVIAAWQTPDTGVPKRIVVRCDGRVNNVKDADGNPGFPCGVLLVRYTIGGLTREVKVDCLSESALTVWAESVDVQAYRDDARIAALAAFPWGPLKPCSKQVVTVAISPAGDTGHADARYLDALLIPPATEEGDDFDVWLAVPPNARLLRLLPNVSGEDGDASATVIDWVANVSYLLWTVSGQRGGNATAIEAVMPYDGSMTQTVFTVPADAQWVKVRMSGGFYEQVNQTVGPIFAEWIMAPATVASQQYKIP